MKDPSAKFETRVEKLRPRSDSENKFAYFRKKNSEKSKIV